MKNIKGIISFVLSLGLILPTNKFVNAYNDENISKDTSKQIELQQIVNYNDKELNIKNKATTNIALNSIIYGTTSSSYDYFKFTTNSDGYIDLKFNQNENVRFNVRLLDINQNTIDDMCTAYGNSSETIRQRLPKGTYYVRVSKYLSSNLDTQYSFSVKHTATNTFEKEFNNEPSFANNINLNTLYSGITESGYYDYFKFTINSKQDIEIKISKNQNARYNLALLDINRNIVAKMSTQNGTGYANLKQNLSSGTYYVRVVKYLGSDPDTQYSFSVNNSAKNGWVKVSDKWYYYSNGEMATGWKLISGSWYYLKTDGKMATNTTIDGWKIGSNGVATPIK